MKTRIVVFLLTLCTAITLRPALAATTAAVDDSLAASARRAIPAEVATGTVKAGLAKGLWNKDRTAVAVVLPRPRGSLVYVFIRQPNGAYLAADASRVEGGNFGKLGGRAADYQRFETRPMQWNDRPDGLYEVVMRTRAWKAGRALSASEPLLIGHEGKIVWR